MLSCMTSIGIAFSVASPFYAARRFSDCGIPAILIELERFIDKVTKSPCLSSCRTVSIFSHIFLVGFGL